MAPATDRRRLDTEQDQQWLSDLVEWAQCLLATFRLQPDLPSC